MSWNEFDLVRLTKLTDRSDIEEAQKISPIPTDRCVVGALQMNVEVGLPVLLLRIIKDGEPNLGETSTSQVRQIVGNSLITGHSVLPIEKVGLRVVEPEKID